MLLVVTTGFAQTLPLDFEDPLDDNWGPFNGATAMVVIDPTDGTNQVLELTSNGNDFDGASINLGQSIDLSDQASNNITLRFWTPDATPRTHLLKLEGGGQPAPATQLYFNTTVAGWQTVTLNFSNVTGNPPLSNSYTILVLFVDSGPGNTATGTYYIDDINAPVGVVIPPDPIPAIPAPIPNVADSEVYSIYNDSNGFSTTFPVAYAFGAFSNEPDLDPGTAENLAVKMNFGVQGWGQGEGGPDDVSAYDFVSFYYWAVDGINGFDFSLISNAGGITEHVYRVGVNEAIVYESWVYVEIPMSYFTNIGFAETALWQWKVGPLNLSVDNAGIVYFDNILFSQNGLSVNDFDTTEFRVFPNPTNSDWTISGTSVMNNVAVYDILGKQVIALTPNAIEATIDASALNSGIYFARIDGVNGSKTVKLIKQ